MVICFNDYSYLLNCLTDMSIVVEDSIVNDDSKNIVFEVSTEVVKIIGINKLITYRKIVDKDKVSVNGVEDTLYLQIRSKELINFLSSYKTLSRTKIKRVLFELINPFKVKCTMIETVEGSDKEYASQWLFENIAIKPTVKQYIDMQKPDTDLTVINTDKFKGLMENFFPSLSSTIDAYSYAIFSSENLIALNQAYTIVGDNPFKDTEIFKGMKLSYKVLNFMNKIIFDFDSISIAKTDRNLYMTTQEGSDIFLMYNSQLPLYKPYLEMIDTTHRIELDRSYLRDILKRLTLSKEVVNVVLDCNDKEVIFKNTKFEQIIDMQAFNDIEGFEKIRFKIMPDILGKALIGNDKNFKVVNIYYSTQNNNNIIIFSDENNSWYTIIRVKVEG